MPGVVGLRHQHADVLADDVGRGVAEYPFGGAVEGFDDALFADDSDGVDGRIDDANAGWKGRGIWTTSGTRANFHSEGGKEAYPKVFKVQMRPDPLAH